MANEVLIVVKGKDEATNVLKNISSQFSNLGKNLSGNLGLSGFNKLNSLLPGVGTALNAVSSGFVKLGQMAASAAMGGMAAITVALTGIGAGLAAITASSVKTAATFEKEMSRVKALTSATASDFEMLSGVAKDLGATTAFTAAEAAQGMQFLAMAGFETTEIISAMPGVLDLAAASQIDLGTAADITSNIMSGFGISAEETTRIVDVLAATTTGANTNMVELGEGMKFAAPIAKQLGLPIEEVAAGMGKLADAGIKGTLAGTQLRGGLLSLITPSEEAATKMSELGINVSEIVDSGGGFLDILQAMSGGLEGMSKSQRTATLEMLVGRRAAGAFGVLLDNMADGSLPAFTNELLNSGGAAKKMADTQLDNLSGAMTLLRSAVDGVKTEIGEQFLPVLTDVVKAITDFVGKHADSFIDFFTGLAGVVAKAANFFTTYMLPVIGQFVDDLLWIGKTIGRIVAPSFDGFGDIILGIGKKVNVLMNIFKRFLAGFEAGGIIGGLQGMQDAMFNFRNIIAQSDPDSFFKKLLHGGVVFTELMINFIKGFKTGGLVQGLENVQEALSSFIKYQPEGFFKSFLEGAIVLSNFLKDLIKGFKTGGIVGGFKVIGEAIDEVLFSIRKKFENLDGASLLDKFIVGILKALDKVRQAIAGLLQGGLDDNAVIGPILKTLDNLIAGFGNLYSQIKNFGFASLFSDDLSPDVLAPFENIINIIKEQLDKIKNALKQTKLGQWFQDIVDGYNQSGIMGIFSALGEDIADAFKNITGKDFWTWLEDVKAEAPTKLGNLAGSIANLLIKNWPIVGAALAKWAFGWWGFLAFTVIPNAPKFLGGLITTISDYLTNNWSEISSSMENWDFWGWLNNDVIPSVQTYMQPLTDAMNKFLTETWPEIQGSLTKWGNTFFDWVDNDVIPNVEPNLTKATSAITKFINDEAPEIAESFNSWNDSVWGWATTAANEASTRLVTITESIRKWSENEQTQNDVNQSSETLANLFIDALVNHLMNASNFIATVAPNIAQAFMNIAATIGNTLSSIHPAFAAVVGVIEGFVNMIQTIFVPGLTEAFGEVTALLNDLGLNWGDVWNALVTATQIVATIIGGLLLGLVSVVSGILAGFVNVIRVSAENTRTVINGIKDIFEGLGKAWAGGLLTIKGIVTGNFDEIKRGIEIWGEGFKQAWGGIWDTVSTIIKAPLDNAKAFIEGFKDGILAIWQGLSDRLVGNSIVPDMIDDIVSTFSNLSDITDNILPGVVDGAKKLFSSIFGGDDTEDGFDLSSFDPSKIVEDLQGNIPDFDIVIQEWMTSFQELINSENSIAMITDAFVQLITSVMAAVKEQAAAEVMTFITGWMQLIAQAFMSEESIASIVEAFRQAWFAALTMINEQVMPEFSMQFAQMQFQTLMAAFAEIDWGEPARKVVEGMTQALQQGASQITQAVNRIVQQFNRLKQVQNSVPSMLVPGSPTPFEIGLRGIADAAKGLPNLGQAFNFGDNGEMSNSAMGGRGLSSAQGDGDVFYVDISINGAQAAKGGGNADEAIRIAMEMLRGRLKSGVAA